MERYFYINPDSAVKALYDKVKSVIRTLTLMPAYMENLDNRADLILADNLLCNNTKIEMLMHVYSCATDAVNEEKITYYSCIDLDTCLDCMRDDDLRVDNEEMRRNKICDKYHSLLDNKDS